MKFFIIIFFLGISVRTSRVLNKIVLDRSLDNGENPEKVEQIEGEEKTDEMKIQKIETHEVEEDKKHCNFDFKSRFVKSISSDFEIGGIEATDKIKEYCPSIEKSCCSENEIEYLFQQISLGKKKFLDISLHFIKDVVVRLENLQEDKIEKFFRQKEEKINKCIKDTPKEKIREFLFDLKKEAPNLLKNYKDYMYESFNSQFKLQCGICDLNNADFFNISKPEENKIIPPYKLLVKMPDELFYFFNQMEYYTKISMFEKLTNFYDCVYSEKETDFDFKTELYASEIHNYIKNNDKSALEENENAVKFFRMNYVPGGTRDIYFKHIPTMLDNMFFDGRSQVDDKNLFYYFWVPLENNNKEDPEFGFGKVDIVTQSEGYSTGDIKIGDNQFVKELKELHLEENKTSFIFISIIMNFFFFILLA